MFDITKYAPAIKQNVSGEIVVCENVSPLEHNLEIHLTNDTITDFSSVTVSRYGTDETDDLKTVIANADGTVEGLTSISPITTLATNVEDITINVSYNANTKQYVDNIIASLQTVILEVAE